MLVTSVVSFSLNVFKRYFPQGPQKVLLCGKRLNCHLEILSVSTSVNS